MALVTCRFCHQFGMEDETFIRYGPRHNAHPKCLIQAKGSKAFEKLPLWQLERFPYFVAQEHGVLSQLETKIAELRARGQP